MPSEAIDPPGVAWRRVSPRYIQARLLSWAVGTILALTSVTVVLLVASYLTDGRLPGTFGWVIPAVIILVSGVRGVLIPARVRAIGYAERQDDLLIRRGVFFQRTIVVPYGRMQYVDVAAGPVDRALGLASIKLLTASPGTNAYIPGLPTAEAARLREQLSALGEARLAGL